ncbi:MAG TPA: hypothetical protein DD670_15685 [Planctomycetaceae bacterium]|nr:hypothetical protein [Planctomycetaceae bacterium]
MQLLSGIGSVGQLPHGRHGVGQQVETVRVDARGAKHRVIAPVEYGVVNGRSLRVESVVAEPGESPIVGRPEIFGEVVNLEQECEIRFGQVAHAGRQGRVLAQRVVMHVNHGFVGGEAEPSQGIEQVFRQRTSAVGAPFIVAFIIQPGDFDQPQVDGPKLLGQAVVPSFLAAAVQQGDLQPGGRIEHRIERAELVLDHASHPAAI